MADGGAPAGPASAVQGFVNNVMSTVTAPIDALNLGLGKATFGILQYLPKFPALRLYQDLVAQFGHSHLHPPTFGVPLPSVGPVLASGCMSVLINKTPAARNGDMGLSVWCGGYFPIFEIFAGSSHVFIGGSRAARAFIDPSFHCLPSPFGGKAGKIGALDIAGALFGVGMSALNVAVAMEKQDAAITASEEASAGQSAADAEAAAADAAAQGVGVVTAAAQLAADIAAAAMGLLMGKDPGVGFPFGMGITGSPDVWIGGFPMPGWMTILKGLLKLLKPVIRRVQMTLPKNSRLRNALCALTGHPVDVASGRMFTNKTDFEIDGRIPIIFERLYDTSSVDYEGPFGWGWTHPYDQHLWESKKHKCLILRNDENRQVRFDLLNVGEKYFQPLERVWLERKSETEYELTDRKTGLIYDFGMLPGSSEDFTSEKDALRLLRISDRNDNKVNLTYSDGLLKNIENGSGVSVDLNYQNIDGKYRVSEIRENLTNGQSISLMNYGYDGEAQLISATNRTYIPYTYNYEEKLMVRETNRNGLSFHFEYSGEGTEARCTHTWGDGGIYERWITYAPNARVTRVKNGLGGETVYEFNELDIVTRITDALGGISSFEYGDRGELLKEIDELGRERSYSYDDQLNCVGVVQEDGTTKRITFNELCGPVSVVDEMGAEWKREYDNRGNLISTINPQNAKRLYEYNSSGDITKFTDALGNSTVLSWAANGQIADVIRPRGAKIIYRRNVRNLLSEIFHEAAGLRIQYSHDDLGRTTKVSEANQRQQSIRIQKYEYDPQDNLTLYTDALGNKTHYGYSGYDKLYERVDALGYKRSFKYDLEERLYQITNERNENYLFEYDLNDRVLEETGFDGSKTEYRYNQSSELVYKKDALNREIFYRRDEMGRITSRLRSDTSEIKYSYDPCGRITTAQNEYSEVKLAYNSTGQIIKEEQADQTIEYSYDAESNRVSRKRLDANSKPVEYSYDPDGNLSRINVADYEVDFEFDLAGRLSRKRISGGLEENFTYDINGRLEGQRVSVGAGGRDIVKRNYSWDALGNITEIQDSLRGARTYSYDAVERLNKVERIISGDAAPKPATQPEKTKGPIPAEKRLWQADSGPRSDSGKINEVEYFSYDGDGNLLERNSNVRGSVKSKYGSGDKLEEKEGTQYIYDAVGNLIKKRQPNGEVLRYEYDIDNQLISVEGGSGGRIEFRYDAFGRRTTKITKAGTTGFLWDGDVLLGEQKDTFQEYLHRGFIPLAKIKPSGIETIHTDYLGTPKEVTSPDGDILWQGNYDEYGQVKAVVNKTDQNIRFQGQYEDEETGLFYNYFRYYDSDSGRYINQDPIGLNGGSNLYSYVSNPLTWVDLLGLHGNDLTDTGEKALYHIKINGETFKYGIADAGRVTKTDIHVVTPNGETKIIPKGTPVRLAQQISKGHTNFDNLEVEIVARGNMTTADIRDIETQKIMDYHAQRGKVPSGNTDHARRFGLEQEDLFGGVNDLKKQQRRNNTPKGDIC